MIKFLKFWPVALAAVAILALGLAACGDDGADAETAELEAIREDLARTSVTAAMASYRAEGIHELDEEATDASEIGAGWGGTVDRLHAVTVGALWPDSLEEQATLLEDELLLASGAVDADDLTGSKEHIALAHAAWHDIEHDAYAYIGGEEHSDEEEAEHSDG